MRLALVSIAASLALTTGCNMVPAEASLRGFPVPVMVGPVDRVGYDGKPLPSRVVNEYEATVYHLHTEHSYDNGAYTVTVVSERERGDFYKHARQATAGFPPGEADIRVDEIKPQAFGLFLGAAMKARVDVHGRVVAVGAQP